MTLLGVAQILFFFAIILAITKPIGIFLYRVFEGQRTFLHTVFRPLEGLIYSVSGIREKEEQTWVSYSASLISLSIFSFYLCICCNGYRDICPLIRCIFPLLSPPQVPHP